MSSNDTLTPVDNQRTLLGLFDAKSSFICVVTVLNFIFNALVIALMVKYRRTMFKDKTMIFMLSLSISDLISGIVFMPLSALACSNFHPGFRFTKGFFPAVNMVSCWFLGYVSLHSLAWVSISKAITVMFPLKFDILLTKARCIYICICIWISGFALASTRLYIKGNQKEYTWRTSICLFKTPKVIKSPSLRYWRMFTLIMTDVLPILAMIISTIFIIGIITKVHYRIHKQKNNMSMVGSKKKDFTRVTLNTIRSSRNILIIVIVSFLMQIPIVAWISSKHLGGYKGSIDPMFTFVAFWSFHSSGMVNSFLFLILYATARKQLVGLFAPVLWMCNMKKDVDFNMNPSGTSSKRNTKRSSISTSSNNDTNSVLSVGSMDKCNPTVDSLPDPGVYKINSADIKPLPLILPAENKRVLSVSQDVKSLQRNLAIAADNATNGHPSNDYENHGYQKEDTVFLVLILIS